MKVGDKVFAPELLRLRPEEVGDACGHGKITSESPPAADCGGRANRRRSRRSLGKAGAGQIRNSNGRMFASAQNRSKPAACRVEGSASHAIMCLTLRQLIGQAMESDVVVLSGGVCRREKSRSCARSAGIDGRRSTRSQSANEAGQADVLWRQAARRETGWARIRFAGASLSVRSCALNCSCGPQSAR